MDLENHHDEDRDDQQRMERAILFLRRHPCDQLGHALWRVERRRSFEHHTQAFALFIKGFDMIGQDLV